MWVLRYCDEFRDNDITIGVYSSRRKAKLVQNTLIENNTRPKMSEEYFSIEYFRVDYFHLKFKSEYNFIEDREDLK